MNQELREEIKTYLREQRERIERNLGFISGEYMAKDFDTENRLQCAMRFDAPEDIDFELMDFYFDGMLSLVLRHAKLFAEKWRNWGRAYEEFKPYIAHFVGWYSFVSEQQHPILCGDGAYSYMCDLLSDTCWKATHKRKSENEQTTGVA